MVADRVVPMPRRRVSDDDLDAAANDILEYGQLVDQLASLLQSAGTMLEAYVAGDEVENLNLAYKFASEAHHVREQMRTWRNRWVTMPSASPAQVVDRLSRTGGR